MGESAESYDWSAVEMTMLEPVPVMKPMRVRSAAVRVGCAKRRSSTMRVPSAVAVTAAGIERTVCA